MTDKQLIEKLGGVLVVSNYLGMDYQRVFNWTHRGIPAHVKVDYPDIFMQKNLNDVKPLQQETTQ